VLKDNRETLMDMAIGARNKMVAIEPELSGSRPGREAKSETEAKPAAEARAPLDVPGRRAGPAFTETDGLNK